MLFRSEKRLDFIVANVLKRDSAVFGANKIDILIIDKYGKRERFSGKTKKKLAKKKPTRRAGFTYWSPEQFAKMQTLAPAKLASKGSLTWRWLAYLLDANSPLASDPQAALKIARRMARVLGYSKRAAVADAPVAPVKPAAAPRRSVRPMPTGGAPVESPATTLERRVSGAKSTGDMLELMREIGTPFEALLKR